MAAFANGFLWVFSLAALLGVVGGALQDSSVFTAFAGPFTLFAILYVLAMSACLLWAPCLPKRVFVPACLLVGWEMVGALPLRFWAGPLWGQVSVSALELAIAIAAFAWLRGQTGRLGVTSAWLTERGPSFSLRSLLLRGASVALALPFALAVYAWVGAASALDHYTAGYMHLRSDGIWSTQRTLARGDQRIVLVGMIHVGQSDFYADVLDGLPSDAVILAEGVSDSEGLLGELRYASVADTFGLSEQAEAFPVHEGDVEGVDDSEPDVVSADVDASEFTEDTRDVLVALGRLLAADSVPAQLAAWSSYEAALSGPGVPAMVWHDILELRNERLLEHVDAELESHSLLVIPWGALHLAAIDSALRERGFEQGGEARERRAIAFPWAAADAPPDVPAAPPAAP